MGGRPIVESDPFGLESYYIPPEYGCNEEFRRGFHEGSLRGLVWTLELASWTNPVDEAVDRGIEHATNGWWPFGVPSPWDACDIAKRRLKRKISDDLKTRATKDGSECVVSHLHHAWPKYLGGPSKQVLIDLPKSVHDAYHSGLDKILPRQWSKKYYDNLSDAAKRQMEQDLADYTKAFDEKYGTDLWQSMLDNGFPGQ